MMLRLDVVEANGSWGSLQPPRTSCV